jgi:hypothetical protein
LWSLGSGNPDTSTPFSNSTQWVDPPKWNMLGGLARATLCYHVQAVLDWAER